MVSLSSNEWKVLTKNEAEEKTGCVEVRVKFLYFLSLHRQSILILLAY